jgi:molybdate transport system ATP-binding protein
MRKSDMELNVSIRKKLNYFDLDLKFTCPDDELLAMIGPSGSGKTTVIRMIAGLAMPDEGRISYGSEVWFDSLQRINITPQQRRLGYVFQDYTLFPHLTLRENTAFATGDLTKADDLLEQFGISHLRNRKPAKVSGGERQRCAICQALARNPRVLLLDEPFSALDFVTRRKLRQDIKLLRHEITSPIVYVTHDIAEAFALADEILPVIDGKIDKSWLQKTIASASETDHRGRAAQIDRLALAK